LSAFDYDALHEPKRRTILLSEQERSSFGNDEETAVTTPSK
jgi:hypothetical protein